MKVEGVPYMPSGPTGMGHAHFWERAMSRRNMLLGTAAAAGLMMGGRLLPPRFGTLVEAAGTAAEPRPIPGGFLVLDNRRYHVYTPGRVNPLDPASPMNEPSLITDFDGVVAIMQTVGQGTGVEHGVEAPMSFDADLRFMAGRYVGRDGEIHQGAFGFI